MKYIKYLGGFLLLTIICLPLLSQTKEWWKDVNNEYINAHGGGVLFYNGLYYWFGEHRPENGFTTEVGVNCYASSDLQNWTHKGVALAVSEEPGSDIERGCIMERPKVIYNKKTGKFVMWFHLELKGQGYGPARAAVAVSDKPEGPYRFVRSGRVNPGIYPENMPEADRKLTWNMKKYKKWWTPEWYKAVNQGLFVKRDIEGGQMSRDMTLFVDDDGKAYHIYSSEENLTLHIAELTDDSARDDFRRSVSCVGSTVCQIGMQDSNGLLKAVFDHLEEKGIDTKKLPRVHISGCPHSCGTHQIGEIGFHGAVKLVDKKPQPAFIIVDGGSEHMGSESFGKMAGNIVAAKIPAFMEALANILNEAPEADFGSWRLTHKTQYMDLIKSFE